MFRRSRHNGFPVYDPAHVDMRVSSAAVCCTSQRFMLPAQLSRHCLCQPCLVHGATALPCSLLQQAGSFRTDGFIMRSQVELLLRERVHCDRHGRYLQAPPQGLDTLEWEDRLATAMAAQLQRHSNCSTGGLLRLASRGMAGTGGEDGSSGSALGRPGSMGSSGSAALLADNPSPFDNQVRPTGRLLLAALLFPDLLRSIGSISSCFSSRQDVSLPLRISRPTQPAKFDFHVALTTAQEVEPHLNLAPFLNRAPATVRLETPATRVHSMMLSLSLRWGCSWLLLVWAGTIAAPGITSVQGIVPCA